MKASAASSSRTTASVLTKNISTAFLRFFSACTGAWNMKARASAWRFAGKSSNATAGKLLLKAKKGWAQNSLSICRLHRNWRIRIFMRQDTKAITILLADDDADDRLLVREAFEENHLLNVMDTVEDGEELMDYLNRRGKYTESAVRPSMILLDLNMPRKSGLEALREIRADADLRSIPVVVLTTSKAEEDIIRSYELGVNSFIVKPVTFESLVELVRTLGRYWFQIVELPSAEN